MIIGLIETLFLIQEWVRYDMDVPSGANLKTPRGLKIDTQTLLKSA
jgi:hypothetical protein